MEMSLALENPSLELPCKRFIGLPLQLVGALRSAGVETLALEGCQCGEAHTVALPDVSNLRGRIHLKSLIVAEQRTAGWKN